MEPGIDTAEKAALRARLAEVREHLSEVLAGVNSGNRDKARTDLMFARAAFDELTAELNAAVRD